MKNRIFKRLVCIMLAIIMAGSFLPLIAAAATEMDAPRYAIASTREEMIDEIARILHRYHPDAWRLLELRSQRTGRSVSHIIGNYVNDASVSWPYRIIDFTSTTIHEEVHVRQAVGGEYAGRLSYIMVDGHLVMLPHMIGLPRTSAATGNLPEGLRSFRWNTYASLTSGNFSNVGNVIGLLGELEAYYVGSLVFYMSFPYVLETFRRNEADAFRLLGTHYLSRLLSYIALPFYEFVFWTLEYMLYLQENHPEYYRMVLDNYDFRRAFTYVFENYQYLAEVAAPRLIQAAIGQLTDMDATITVDGMTWLVNPVNGRAEILLYVCETSPHAGGNHQLTRSTAERAVIRDHISAPRYVNMLNALLVDGSTSATPQQPEPQIQQPSSWAVEQVNAAIAAGLVPQNLQSAYIQSTTRAEFAALAVALYETVTGREIAGRMQFNDTNDVNVQKMGYLGVVTGVGGGNFAPTNTLTREQAAVMLARLAYAIGQPLPPSAPTFADNAQISGWAVDGVGQMQASGIMGGVGNNQFSPSGSYTREQSIVTMLRLFDLLS